MSKRKEKPALFATLDMAIAQAGIKGLDTLDLYGLTTWAMSEGRRFPWYYRHERSILDNEGGRDHVILSIAGAALAHMSKGMDLPHACFQAAKDWRSELRRQWGDNGQADQWDRPRNFTELELDSKSGNYTVEEWITEQAIELAGPPADEFDPDNIKDPRLKQLWGDFTPGEQELLTAMADGPNARQAGELVGIGHMAARSRLHRARLKAKGPAT